MMLPMASKPDRRWAETKGRDAEGISLRSFKVHDNLWAHAKERAATDGVSVSEVVRRALVAYVTPTDQTSSDNN
jgi:hypothetical protein